MTENITVASGEMSYIVPYDDQISIENRADCKKLEMSPAQKGQVNAFLQQIPTIMAAETLSQAYILKFPPDLSGRLMALRQGGLSSTIIGENGLIKGTASLYSLNAQAVMLGAFSVISIASGQYFLSQINNDLSLIKQSIDKILEFLYGDKRAELMSEVMFARYAYKNYSSIMDPCE